jgi:hypothetical protein
MDQILTMSGVAPTAGGRLSVKAVTLKQLIEDAYQVNARAIVGGPSWMDLERYDVEAKAADPVGVEPTTCPTSGGSVVLATQVGRVRYFECPSRSLTNDVAIGCHDNCPRWHRVVELPRWCRFIPPLQFSATGCDET